MKSILLDEKLLGLVEMTSGLVNASFSFPEWQAVKMQAVKYFFEESSKKYFSNKRARRASDVL